MKYISVLLTTGQWCIMTKNGIQWNIGTVVEVQQQQQRKLQQFPLLENRPLQGQHQVST